MLPRSSPLIRQRNHSRPASCGLVPLSLSETASGWRVAANRAMLLPDVGLLQTDLVGASRLASIVSLESTRENPLSLELACMARHYQKPVLHRDRCICRRRDLHMACKCRDYARVPRTMRGRVRIGPPGIVLKLASRYGLHGCKLPFTSRGPICENAENN